MVEKISDVDASCTFEFRFPILVLVIYVCAMRGLHILLGKMARPNGPSLSYIYCSGTRVHGNHKDDISTSDRAAVDETRAMSITKWRLPHERKIISAAAEFLNTLTANVIRPSLLYGYSASITAGIFSSAHAGEIKFAGDGTERIATVHAEDLAQRRAVRPFWAKCTCN